MNLRSPFETKVLVAFATAVLVVAALWVAHTHEVLESLTHVQIEF